MQSHVELTEFILKCCYEVVNGLGVGFLEAVYKNALVVALNDRSVKVETEKVFEVLFRKKRIGLYIADVVVDNSVIVEVKSCPSLLPVHQAQLINYLAVSSCPVGLLVNFGSKKLEIRRLHHPKYSMQKCDEVVHF